MVLSSCGARNVTLEERSELSDLRDVVGFFDGVVVAGGSFSGPSEEPHAVATRGTLLALHAEGFPTLALCFAHQALAVAMGLGL
jgi:GMP synthase-like glutamine amidotransferase